MTTSSEPAPADMLASGPALRLACRTSGDTEGSYDYARLDLSPLGARRLLAYRPVFARVKEHDDRLYCLEFFDYEVSYGSSLGGDGIEDGDEKEWHSIPAEVEMSGYSGDHTRAAAETMKVTADGVLWCAHAKHGDGAFETPEISWAALNKVAAGENPFPPPVPEDGEDEEEVDSEYGRCRECGRLMLITPDGVSHHLQDRSTTEVDHDQDARHVAVMDEDDEAEVKAMTEPVKCSRCNTTYDEAKGDGFDGLCPECADETEPEDEDEDEFEGLDEEGIIANRGWNEDTMLVLQRRYIEQGSPGNYEDWLRQLAREEEAEYRASLKPKKDAHSEGD